MSILCGTDFSEAAQQAITAAAQIAARTQTPLHLVHCVPAGTPHPDDAPKSEYVEWVLLQLHSDAERARKLGAQVRVHMKRGSPDDCMIALSREVASQLIVIGPLGGRSPGTFQLGGHADRILQRAHVPVLIVRDAEPFKAWLNGERPLRVVLGADLSRSTDAAMEVVKRWGQLSSCDVTAIHLYWPPEQFARLGVEGVRSYLDPDPDVTKTLTREIRSRLAPADESDSIQVHVEPHLGRLGDRLAALALQRKADVLVVGSHVRTKLGRIWEGSVSRWALHAAQTSVLCVPAPRPATGVEVPRTRSVLAATDLSPEGNAAVGLAYSLVEPGGTVHVVHVVPVHDVQPLEPHDIFALERAPKPDARREQTHRALAALVPEDFRDCATRLHVLESNTVAAAIRQAALRLDADAICIGCRGRTSLVQTLLGLISSDVVAHAERPVLLAHAPRE